MDLLRFVADVKFNTPKPGDMTVVYGYLGVNGGCLVPLPEDYPVPEESEAVLSADSTLTADATVIQGGA